MTLHGGQESFSCWFHGVRGVMFAVRRTRPEDLFLFLADRCGCSSTAYLKGPASAGAVAEPLTQALWSIDDLATGQWMAPAVGNVSYACFGGNIGGDEQPIRPGAASITADEQTADPVCAGSRTEGGSIRCVRGGS